MSKKAIIPIFLTLTAVTVLVINLYQHLKIDRHLSEGTPLPAFELFNAETGKKFTNLDIRGKVVFINFWATWCKPCIEELPSINRLNNLMANQKDFVMMTIVYNENPKVSLKYIKKTGYNLPVYSDPFGNTAKKLGLTGVPETYIIDKKGIIRKVSLGPDRWDSDSNVSFVKSLLQN